MKQQFPGQLKDEEVLLFFRRHPIVMRKGFLILLATVLLGALAGLVTSRNDDTVSGLLRHFGGSVGVGVLLGLVGLFYYWIGWFYSVCIITNQRFLQVRQVGIFKSRSVNDINLHRILSVNYQVKGIFETMLGFGTIIIQTLVGDFVIQKVGHPAKTQAGIVTAIKESGVELDESIDDSK